jgi:hypothetical protein
MLLPREYVTVGAPKVERLHAAKAAWSPGPHLTLAYTRHTFAVKLFGGDSVTKTWRDHVHVLTSCTAAATTDSDDLISPAAFVGRFDQSMSTQQ